MPVIGVTSNSQESARRYLEAVERGGGTPRLLLPGGSQAPQEVLDELDGLLLTGGPDVHPSRYGQEADPSAGLELAPALDDLEFPMLAAALERDLPVLGICRGMQVLNVVLGGRLIQDLPGHRATKDQDGHWNSARHYIWVSLGSKLAQVLGAGGKVRVNSRHHQGLREAQKSAALMASAYSLEDGLVEGIESPDHTWVLGVQCHPERSDEVPRQFARLFEVLVERAGRRAGAGTG
ncbi:MAG: gamma-glutamyl-gamma-aminobutyrate hydrolase family protein [Chloroflexi bacterium]|nr:gamma-glutamyl-gamma-aminobutyrate hydrolase family protein [Chloroflexota bacterium]